jgi:hypothetical protein
MSDVCPVVRYLVVCEDRATDAGSTHSITLTNLISAIRSVEEPAYPLLYRELCIYAQLTDCRGAADVRVTVVHADTGEFAYAGPPSPWRASLPNDPLAVGGLRFRIRNVHFPRQGLYWVQFWYNGEVLAEQPLVLR